MKLRIYGKVKDSKTARTIIGANVRLFLGKKMLQQVKSIENGFFEAVAEIDDSLIESGQQLKVTIEKEGYKIQEHRVFTTEGSFNLDVTLEPLVVHTSKKSFNWLPVIMVGAILFLLLAGGAITWMLIFRSKSLKIINFSSDSSLIKVGESATLRWETENASSVRIEPDIGGVELSGNIQVWPIRTMEYILIAKDEEGKMISKALTIELDQRYANEFLDISDKTQTKAGGLNIKGSVGIGTTTPSTELEVNGAVTAKAFSGLFNWSNIANIPADFADGDNVNDADADPENEIQTLSTSGNKITLSNGGSITAPYAINADKVDGKDASELVNEISGKGSTNYIGKWSDSGSIGNSEIYDDNGKIGIGTREPDAKLHVKGEVKSVVNGINFYMVPAGVILPWYPRSKSVPKGWAICNGSNGTPDLRDRFILGTAEGENPGGTGGVSSYSLSVSQLPSHKHTGSTHSGGSHYHSGSTNNPGNHSHEIPMGNKDDLNCTHVRGQRPLADGPDTYWTGVNTRSSGSHSHSFSTSSSGSHSHSFTTNATGSGARIDNRPKFYKLVFIMKLD